MYPLVRVLKDQDNRRHGLPVRDIRNFSPGHKMDLDKRPVYTVFWKDGRDSENTCDYSAQILMLGVSFVWPLVLFAVEKTSRDANSVVFHNRASDLLSNLHLNQSQQSPLHRPWHVKKGNGLLLSISPGDTLTSSNYSQQVEGWLYKLLELWVLLQLQLQRRIILTPTQAKRVMAHTKPSLVLKETAQSIWTTPWLARRSMSGQLPPNKRGSGEQPKPALTSEKINVVESILGSCSAVVRASDADFSRLPDTAAIIAGVHQLPAP
ncbi:hypothetical protein ISCGN_032048 [Ixodes scapularis]